MKMLVQGLCVGSLEPGEFEGYGFGMIGVLVQEVMTSQVFPRELDEGFGGWLASIREDLSVDVMAQLLNAYFVDSCRRGYWAHVVSVSKLATTKKMPQSGGGGLTSQCSRGCRMVLGLGGPGDGRLPSDLSSAPRLGSMFSESDKARGGAIGLQKTSGRAEHSISPGRAFGPPIYELPRRGPRKWASAEPDRSPTESEGQ